jgi:hypothetical protein
MQDPVRLDSISTKLTEALRRANDRQRLQAVLETCLLAASSSGLAGKDVEAAVEILRHGRRSVAILRRLERLSRKFDDQYLQLSADRQSDKPIGLEALTLFRKARAASALAFALSSDPDGFCESVYEAIMASPDQSKVVKAALPSEN